MSSKKRLMVNLPKPVYEKLKKLSEESGNSMNSYIREAIHFFFKKNGMKGENDE